VAAGIVLVRLEADLARFVAGWALVGKLPEERSETVVGTVDAAIGVDTVHMQVEVVEPRLQEGALAVDAEDDGPKRH
jgi:hypothetical protein